MNTYVHGHTHKSIFVNSQYKIFEKSPIWAQKGKHTKAFKFSVINLRGFIYGPNVFFQLLAFIRLPIDLVFTVLVL